MHAPAREEEDHQTKLPVKFPDQPLPDEARIGPAKAAAAANLGRRIFVFSGHLRLTHTSFPPFLDPLNSFPWPLFADSSPFESYDENKVGRLLD